MTQKIEMIKALRETTGVSMGKCKDALEATGYDQARALLLLKEWGDADASARRERKVAEGRVASYIHGEGRVGVLLQVDCESDFVAKGQEFRTFMHEVCLQVAAMNPQFVDRAAIPAERMLQERTALRARALASGKPEAFIDRIVSGQIDKMCAQVCLLEQPWVKDPTRTIGDLLNDLIQVTGENVRVSRFSRFEAGAQ